MSKLTQSTNGYCVFTRRFDKVILASALRASSISQQRAWDLFMEQTLERRTAWELQGLEQAERLRAAFRERAARHAGNVACRSLRFNAGRTNAPSRRSRRRRSSFSCPSWNGCGNPRFHDALLEGWLVPAAVALDRQAEEPGTALRPPSYRLRSGRCFQAPRDRYSISDAHARSALAQGECRRRSDPLGAASRQEAYPHHRKAIVVISDGAPVG